MKYLLFILFFFSPIAYSSSKDRGLKPEDVLSQAEIQSIIETNNYFYYKELDLKNPIWMNTERLYAKHFLGEREFKLSEKDVAQKTVECFPIQYQLEILYRDKMAVHSSIGGVIPSLNISFGQGVTYGIDRIFSGLFSFLLPAQWMKIANQERLYQISYHTLSKKILDLVLKARLSYIELHKKIQEFETVNYYLIHMQILALSDREYFHENHLIQAAISKMAINMAERRSAIRIAFDDLASLMSMERDDTDLTLNRLNIEDIKNFPKKPKFRTESGEEEVPSKEDFLREVVSKSIELKIVRELYEVSKMNIGIEALGGTFSTNEAGATQRHDGVFNLNLGYGTVPDILASVSKKRSAKIDVKNEVIGMLTIARKTYDTYINSRTEYVEAKKSLRLNRNMFKSNMKTLVARKDSSQGLPVILGISFLMEAEMSLTDSLHKFLESKAYMERFLLTESSEYLEHVPEKDKILKAFEKSKVDFKKGLLRDTDLLQNLKKIRKSNDLNYFLYGNQNRFDVFFTENRKQEVKDIVQKKIETLLENTVPIRRGEKYFKILEKYILENQIYLTEKQQKILEKRLKKTF
jgi:hypothetical protein